MATVNMERNEKLFLPQFKWNQNSFPICLCLLIIGICAIAFYWVFVCNIHSFSFALSLMEMIYLDQMALFHSSMIQRVHFLKRIKITEEVGSFSLKSILQMFPCFCRIVISIKCNFFNLWTQYDTSFSITSIFFPKTINQFQMMWHRVRQFRHDEEISEDDQLCI